MAEGTGSGVVGYNEGYIGMTEWTERDILEVMGDQYPISPFLHTGLYQDKI